MEMNQKKRWENKGKQEPVEAVLEEGRVHLSLAETYRDPLAGWGWGADKTTKLSGRLIDLEGLFSSRSSSTDASRGATQIKTVLVVSAKTFIKTLRRPVRMVLRDNPETGVTLNAFKLTEPLGRSAPKISKYLMQIRPFVETLDELLKPYFNGVSPLSLLETAKKDLDAASATQKLKRKTIPAATKNMYAQSGEIIELIEEMNRVAKNAFANQPEIAAQFNKDIIESASRPGPTTAPDPAPTPAPTPAQDAATPAA
jgi:hypothetical protein